MTIKSTSASRCTLCGGTGHHAHACRWAATLRPALRFEAETQAWAHTNPHATPDEYEQAVREIAARLGI